MLDDECQGIHQSEDRQSTVTLEKQSGAQCLQSGISVRGFVTLSSLAPPSQASRVTWAPRFCLLNPPRTSAMSRVPSASALRYLGTAGLHNTSTLSPCVVRLVLEVVWVIPEVANSIMCVNCPRPMGVKHEKIKFPSGSKMNRWIIPIEVLVRLAGCIRVVHLRPCTKDEVLLA